MALVDHATRTVVGTALVSAGSLNSAAFSPDDRAVRFFHATALAPLPGMLVTDTGFEVYMLAFALDSRRLLVGGAATRVLLVSIPAE